MKKIFFLYLLTLVLSCCNEPSKKTLKTNVAFNLEEFNIPQTTIRAIEVINDSTVWFAGSNGTYGYTLNGGTDWFVDSLLHNEKKLEMRSIRVLPNGNVFVVGVADPAVIYMSEDRGVTWHLVYADLSENAFFDAIAFWDEERGMLLGDAQDGCFHIAITKDGGYTWNKVPCANIPVALVSEGPFAASNTNIATSRNKAWFGTGGKSASRVYISEDRGETWKVTKTLIVSGKPMTGIFSIDFFNDELGIIGGGNWEKVDEKDSVLAISFDGGKSWKNIESPEIDGYISCIQFIPHSDGLGLVALKGRARGGESSMSYSVNSGFSWKTYPNSNYLSIKFANDSVAWLGGKNKIARLKISNK